MQGLGFRGRRKNSGSSSRPHIMCLGLLQTSSLGSTQRNERSSSMASLLGLKLHRV